MKFRMKALWAVVMIPLTMTVTAANVEAESITENWVAESEDGAQGTDGTESDSGPYLFEWLTGEHRESLKELDLNKAKGPIEGIQPTDYVSLPDIEGQNITPPDKEAPTEEEILSRLYPYLPYNNDGTRASITGKWLAEIAMERYILPCGSGIIKNWFSRSLGRGCPGKKHILRSGRI